MAMPAGFVTMVVATVTEHTADVAERITGILLSTLTSAHFTSDSVTSPSTPNDAYQGSCFDVRTLFTGPLV